MKQSIIASQVEAETTASFPILLEDKGFANLLRKKITQGATVPEIVRAVVKYANEELI